MKNRELQSLSERDERHGKEEMREGDGKGRIKRLESVIDQLSPGGVNYFRLYLKYDCVDNQIFIYHK